MKNSGKTAFHQITSLLVTVLTTSSTLIPQLVTVTQNDLLYQLPRASAILCTRKYSFCRFYHILILKFCHPYPYSYPQPRPISPTAIFYHSHSSFLSHSRPLSSSPTAAYYLIHSLLLPHPFVLLNSPTVSS